MPDTVSVHPPPFDYYNPAYQAAAAAAKARSHGRCQICGEKRAPLHAHHWGRPYPPAHQTTAADLTALCEDCHIVGHLRTLYEAAGGAPAVLCGAWSETVATLLLRTVVHLPGSPTRVGRPVRADGQWAAILTGGSRPVVGEVVALCTKTCWQAVTVTAVIDGRPGRWCVRTRFGVTQPIAA